jgi:hypothetical protein
MLVNIARYRQWPISRRLAIRMRLREGFRAANSAAVMTSTLRYPGRGKTDTPPPVANEDNIATN